MIERGNWPTNMKAGQINDKWLTLKVTFKSNVKGVIKELAVGISTLLSLERFQTCSQRKMSEGELTTYGERGWDEKDKDVPEQAVPAKNATLKEHLFCIASYMT